MRIKITFSYDGSKFNGFQRLKGSRSVQLEIENALSVIYGNKIEIKGAGRTDAGVHANNQVAHFDTDIRIKSLKAKINALVNPDIYIKSISKVKESFHARKSVKKKEYIYKINMGPFKSSYNNYFCQPRFKLDIPLMKEAARYFVGTHDFRNFVSGENDNYISTIYAINFIKVGSILEIRFIGKSFYRYMVRNMVGALIEVGKYKIKYDQIREMVENYEKRQSLPTAEPQGLYLNKIWY